MYRLRYMRRGCVKAVDCIVAAPFNDLHTVQRRIDVAKRYVEDCHPTTCKAEMAPEWITLNDTFIRRTIEVISSRLELYEVVESMPCGRNSSIERGPGRADEKPVDAPCA